MLLLVLDIAVAIGDIAFAIGNAAGNLVAFTGPMFRHGVGLLQAMHRFLTTTIGDARDSGRDAAVVGPEGEDIHPP